jgi:hypothetical protein
MMHAQKIAAHTVCRFQTAEVFSIIFVELTAQMQPILSSMREKYIMPCVTSLGLFG